MLTNYQRAKKKRKLLDLNALVISEVLMTLRVRLS
jgi:hypothetical protein